MTRRCLIASASISGLGSATVLSGITTASERSGENRSVSEASEAPRALLTSRYARASNIGRSGSPAIKLSRYADRLAVAVRAVAMLTIAQGMLSQLVTPHGKSGPLVPFTVKNGTEHQLLQGITGGYLQPQTIL